MIEKILERLEAERNEAKLPDGDYFLGKYIAYDDAMKIVQEVAKEYGTASDNDVAVVSALPSLYPLQKFEEEAIHKVVASAKGNGWIPVETELPPMPKENPAIENKPLELYLITVKGCDYPFRAIWNGKEFTDGWGKVEAIAWQPLPAPYRKGE